MCGRYSLTTPLEALIQAFAFVERPNLPPRFNIAPTQPVPVITRGGDGLRHVAFMRWGLVPSWAKEIRDPPLINARSDSVASKPAFRAAFRRHRALMPADGFYEWKAEKSGKQPYRLTLADGSPFAIAALAETWTSADGGEIPSVALITVDANPTAAAIHDRMPAILPLDAIGPWLDPQTEAKDLLALLRPYDAGAMKVHPVSRRLNSARDDDADLIAPVTLVPEKKPDPPPPPRQGSLF
ncbi:MAG: SOS response-associated peptidase [Alphaproteobacteria bacterium]|nr:SOS response-associated peptidase [Alphaproteobacteria bacterium]